jgi:hypothetical protein
MELIVCLNRAKYLLRSNVRNLLFADDINYTLLKNCSQLDTNLQQKKPVSSAPFITGHCGWNNGGVNHQSRRRQREIGGRLKEIPDR